MKELHDYFPELSVEQKILFDRIPEVYKDWNQKINVVSRKDVEDIEIRHVIHSLAIARIFEFLPGQKVFGHRNWRGISWNSIGHTLS